RYADPACDPRLSAAETGKCQCPAADAALLACHQFLRAAAPAHYSCVRLAETTVPERSARILLVDDEQSIQTLLSYPLRKEGYEVVQATDGRQALDRFDEQMFDLVVLDLRLPKVDGLEVCRRLRSRSSVPIIILTAKSEELHRLPGREPGPDDYTTKPFSLRDFSSRIKAALRRAEMVRPAETAPD